jgi:hypothetical protein
MGWTASTRGFLIVFLLGAMAAAAQSTLPATSPTVLPATTTTPASATPGTSQKGSPAAVSYTGQQLEITANNSSLNQILRQVSRLTGMVITGGVTEQRVFGEYGPAAPAEVLGTLLDGTNSNMLLIAGQSGRPVKLILTPREGGVTPPNPNAPGFNDGDPIREEPAQPRNVDNPHGEPPRPRGASGSSITGVPPSPPTTGGSADGSSTPAANPATPSGPLTPQQIYQQLQQLQKVQRQPPQQPAQPPPQ